VRSEKQEADPSTCLPVGKASLRMTEKIKDYREQNKTKKSKA